MTASGMALKNEVIITIIDKNGVVLDNRNGYNDIAEGDPDSVDNGLVFLLMRLFNAQTPTYYDPTDHIKYIEIGTGTASASGIQTPFAPVERKTIADIDADFDETGGTWYDNPTFEVSVSWIGGDALNGITEVGLLTSASTPELFAFKNYGTAINKPSGADLTITWRVTASYTS